MEEKDFNRVLFKNFRLAGGMAHKISDESRVFKPCDGFAVLKDDVFFIESKLIKADFTSFNFNKLEDNQKKELSLIHHNTRKDNIFSLVAVAYYLPNKFYGFFLFDYAFIEDCMLIEKKFSFPKKDMVAFKEDGYFIDLVRDKELKEYIFDVTKIREKIIGGWTR